MATTRRTTASPANPASSTSPVATKAPSKAATPRRAKPATTVSTKATPVSKTAKTAKTAKAANVATVVKAIPTEKPRKPKMVRDSFTMPKAEYAVIDTLKARAGEAGHSAKKSELLRAGIKLLDALAPAALAAALKALPAIKTGRPAKG